MTRSKGIIGLVAVTIIVAATLAVVYLRSRPEICDGVGRDVGGCERDQPEFTARDCTELAEEFAVQLEDRLTDVFDGPSPRGKTYATKSGEVQMLVIVRMNQHMQRQGLICDPRTVLSRSEPHFSRAFQDQAPSYIDDGDMAYSWDDYRLDLLDDLQVIEWQKG